MAQITVDNFCLINKGDVLICVSNDGFHNLKIGKNYKIEYIWNLDGGGGTIMFKFENIKGYYPSYCFEL